jgi:squalene synthase HpnC
MSAAHHGKAYHGGEHYENFPVASWLLPAQMRAPVLALYRFARTADDIADEGVRNADARLIELDMLAQGLGMQAGDHVPTVASGPAIAMDTLHRIAAQLAHHLADAGLPFQAAHDLLSAFRQDAMFRPLATEDDVLDYCMRSAAPVGRMVLGFAGIRAWDRTDACIAASDAICTGLQLANFAQDMGEDLGRGRIYAPTSWWPQGWDAGHAALADDAHARRALPERMAAWALEHLHQGRHLPAWLLDAPIPGRRRLALEISMTIQGGCEIARRVIDDPLAVWNRSPLIPAHRLPMLLLRAIHALTRHDA